MLWTDVLCEKLELSVNAMVVDQVERVFRLTVVLELWAAFASVLWDVQTDHFYCISLLIDKVHSFFDLSKSTLTDVLYVFELLLESTCIQKILKRRLFWYFTDAIQLNHFTFLLLLVLLSLIFIINNLIRLFIVIWGESFAEHWIIIISLWFGKEQLAQRRRLWLIFLRTWSPIYLCSCQCDFVWIIWDLIWKLEEALWLPWCFWMLWLGWARSLRGSVFLHFKMVIFGARVFFWLIATLLWLSLRHLERLFLLGIIAICNLEVARSLLVLLIVLRRRSVTKLIDIPSGQDAHDFVLFDSCLEGNLEIHVLLPYLHAVDFALGEHFSQDLSLKTTLIIATLLDAQGSN